MAFLNTMFAFMGEIALSEITNSDVKKDKLFIQFVNKDRTFVRPHKWGLDIWSDEWLMM